MRSKTITTLMLTLFLASMLSMAFVIPAKAQEDKEFGTALYFDGNDYVEMPDHPSLDITKVITIEAWINVKGGVGRWRNIVTKWGPDERSYIINVNPDGKADFWISTDGTHVEGVTAFYATGTTILSMGRWYHVAGVYDGYYLKVFVNGIEEGSTAFSGTIHSGTASLRISVNGGEVNYFDGIIDEVRISNIARTSFDLSKPLTADTNTVALWHFNEGSGQTVADETGVNNGRLGSTNGPDDNDPTWVYTTLDYEVLKTTYYKLKADYDKLKTDYDSLQTSYTSLKGDYDSLKASYDKLKKDYDSLKAVYDTLKTEHESTTRQLGTNTNLMYLFIITTIAFMVTIVYFARRKPKTT